MFQSPQPIIFHQRHRDHHTFFSIHTQSLLVPLASQASRASPLDLLLKELVDGEGDGLAGRDTHDTGGDALVEGVETFLPVVAFRLVADHRYDTEKGTGCYSLEHLTRDLGNSLERRLAGLSNALLESGLDGIDRGVGERTHGTGNETDEGGLVRGQVLADVLGLPLIEPLLEVAVSSEVDSLVGTLAESGQGNTTVERTETLLLDDSVERMGGVAVLGNVQRISHGVVLGLETNLDDLHGGDDGNGLGNTGSKTGEEGSLAGDNTGLLIGKELLVPLERGEADGHLGDDTGQDGTETLVETESGLLLDNLDTGLDEAALGLARHAAALRKLHADLDGICGNAEVSRSPGFKAQRGHAIRDCLPRGWQTRASIIPAPPPAVVA